MLDKKWIQELTLLVIMHKDHRQTIVRMIKNLCCLLLAGTRLVLADDKHHAEQYHGNSHPVCASTCIYIEIHCKDEDTWGSALRRAQQVFSLPHFINSQLAFIEKIIPLPEYMYLFKLSHPGKRSIIISVNFYFPPNLFEVYSIMMEKEKIRIIREDSIDEQGKPNEEWRCGYAQLEECFKRLDQLISKNNTRQHGTRFLFRLDEKCTLGAYWDYVESFLHKYGWRTGLYPRLSEKHKKFPIPSPPPWNHHLPSIDIRL